jgi:4a-hydroxytetrahydrobiopterin dehydratase
MAQLISATDFDQSPGVTDWRYLLGQIEAQYRAGSFDGATAFAQQVAEAANAADHHPDIDIRYPDRVFITLMTHAVNGLTDLDIGLARTISGLAVQLAVACEPSPVSRVEVAIDAMNIDAVRPFWRAILGYEEAAPEADGTIEVLVDPNRIGPTFWFQQMDEPRTDRNRIHLDVTVPHDQAEDRIAAAIAAGGHLVSDRRAKAFWVLADVEGNEACICTWQDRD